MAFSALLGTASARPGNVILAYAGNPVTPLVFSDKWEPATSQGVRVKGLRGWTQARTFEPPWDVILDPAIALKTGWDTMTQPWVRGTPPRHAQHDPSAFISDFYFHLIGNPPAILLRQLQTGYRSFSEHV